MSMDLKSVRCISAVIVMFSKIPPRKGRINLITAITGKLYFLWAFSWSLFTKANMKFLAIELEKVIWRMGRDST